MSDAPVLSPLIRLSDFIDEVDEPPSQNSLQTYIQRLREHGFDVSATIERALACGAKLSPEVHSPAISRPYNCCRMPEIVQTWATI